MRSGSGSGRPQFCYEAGASHIWLRARPRGTLISMEATPQIRFRKLRIAWSVVWGFFAVLLCVLWVRSYWRHEVLGRYWGSHYLAFAARRGEVGFTSAYQQNGDPTPWRIRSYPVPAGDTFQGVFDETEQIPAHYAFGTRWFIYANSLMIGVPFLFLVVISSSIAAIASIRFRFSLRTLVLAMTFVAVVLGLTVWALR